ncbi:PREDICTED: cytochrome P450 4C1-like, partial [Polistes dominula]|uniref:Cytochrome P450 4C1-like n=1 Tax=Polistes dominula TaxID=743375 RepID=A0ABM1IGP2_POLDO
MMYAVLLGTILFLFLLHCFIKYRRVGRLLSLISGPKEYPIIGNMHHVQVDNNHFLEELWKLGRVHYPIYKLWSFFISSVVLLDPDDIQVLLSSNENLEKGINYKSFLPWLSSGLLTSYGQKWRLRRKMLTPAFHFSILKHYFINLIEESQELVESLQNEGDGNPVVQDLRTFISKYTLNAICQTSLGTQLTGKGEIESKYRQAVHVYATILAYRSFRPLYLSETIFAFSPLGRVQTEALITLHSFSR